MDNRGQVQAEGPKAAEEEVSNMDEKACRECRLIISHGDTCPICGSKSLANKWSGYVIVINSEKSQIAKMMNIKVNSTYAINVD
jgi:DNA-directed RNA polymerase subunit E"